MRCSICCASSKVHNENNALHFKTKTKERKKGIAFAFAEAFGRMNIHKQCNTKCTCSIKANDSLECDFLGKIQAYAKMCARELADYKLWMNN